MDWKGFVASVVGSLAWPAVVVVLLIVLRKHLGGIAERIEEITLPGGAKAKFVRALEQIRADQELVAAEHPAIEQHLPNPDKRALELANQFPEAAVMEAYKEVEAILLELRERLDLPPRTNLRSVIRRLVEQGLVDSDVEPLFASFQQARNASAHAGDRNRVTPGEALEFMSQAQFLVALFRGVLNRMQR